MPKRFLQVYVFSFAAALKRGVAERPSIDSPGRNRLRSSYHRHPTAAPTGATTCDYIMPLVHPAALKSSEESSLFLCPLTGKLVRKLVRKFILVNAWVPIYVPVLAIGILCLVFVVFTAAIRFCRLHGDFHIDLIHIAPQAALVQHSKDSGKSLSPSFFLIHGLEAEII